MNGRVLIADDHPVVREAIRLVISAKFDDLAVDEASSVGEVVEAIQSRSGYRLVILDLMLPDAHGFSGLILLRKLLEQTPIVMISSRHDPQTLASAHILGASGFIPKSMSLTKMGEVFQKALRGEISFPAAARSPGGLSEGVAGASRKLATLSGAQLRVLLALADGKLNKQIAVEMGVTEATIKAHLTAIFRKLAVGNRTQAILLARPLLDSGQLSSGAQSRSR